MNRTDRLVAMVMYLQSRRVVKAEDLAAHFEVNIRTVYRDVSALSEAGVPVAGEAGVGYSLVKGYHLPPVMFTADEALALFIGGEMVKQFSDASMAEPMESALLKIRSVLPRERQDDLERMAKATAIYGAARPPTALDQRTLLPVQQAIVGRRVLRMTYRGKARAEATTRDVEPLGVTYHGSAWYVVAWCRMRGDFRYFKLERLHALEVLTERFPARPDFSLREYLQKSMEPETTVAACVRLSPEALERVRRDNLANITAERTVPGGVEVELRTYSLEWLARSIVAFAGEAEALAPAKLRTLVKKAAEAVLKQHR